MYLSLSRLAVFLLYAVSVAGQANAAEEIRYLNFSVKNQHDVYLRDLKVEEIRLHLDGEPAEIRYLGYKEVDSLSVILLENSPRTALYPVSMPQWGQVNPIDSIRFQMYYGFFPQITEKGSVMLAEFGKEIRILQEFTSFPDLLMQALHQLQPDYVKSGINDPEVGRAIGRGVDWLRDRPEKRKSLILFTTHVDRETYGNLEEYQEMLRESDVELYVLSYAAARPSGIGVSFEERMNKYFFKRLADETAGWVYIVGEYTYLDELFTDFKGRLNNNYTIAFPVEPDKTSRPHEIRLEILREKCKVKHRKLLIY